MPPASPVPTPPASPVPTPPAAPVPTPPVAKQPASGQPTVNRRPTVGGRPTSGAGAGAEEQGERGLRGLVGSGSSQVSIGAALRARDSSRPTDQDFAEADRDLVIVRRNWLPREDLPRR
ncbi:hypothetical protein [Actinoplanes sp. NPDC051851]|uniref:hypothetical protein n=1 Tax=Actinoplanes sp. NPDC051851 TaxID=3154753 RepID=UPI00344AEC04